MSALYVLSLRAITDERAALHALRAVLKHAKYRGLLAVSVRELPSIDTQTISRRDARRPTVRSASVVTKEGIMPSAREFGFKNKWIKLEDLHDRPPMRECIGVAKPEDGKYGKLVLTFEPSGKQLSLNATSVEALIEAFGEDYDEWSGRFVEVYAGQTPGKDGMVDAVLVRAAEAPVDAAVAAKAVKATKAAAEKARKASDMDDQIPF